MNSDDEYHFSLIIFRKSNVSRNAQSSFAGVCVASAGIITRLPDYWCKFCVEHRIGHVVAISII